MRVVTEETITELVGHESEPSGWFQVTQDQVNAFAACTHDHQFIHTDPEAAAKTEFGGTIAHGFLTLSMLSHFAAQYSPKVENCAHLVNYGGDRFRFLEPVKVGSSIRARSRTISVEKKGPKAYLVKSTITVEIENSDKPALIADMLGLVVFN